MSASTVAAIVARIKTTGLRCYDAAPSSSTYPYVVVYADAAPRSSDREADVRVQADLGWQTTVVGETSGQCRAALDRTGEDTAPTQMVSNREIGQQRAARFVIPRLRRQQSERRLGHVGRYCGDHVQTAA